MRADAQGGLAAFTALLIALLLLSVVQTVSFPVLPAVYPPETVSVGDPSTGQRMTGFLWGYRALDLVAQAVLLFASAIGCLAMLRRTQDGR